ncbi:MAG: hypothetical protein QM658_13750 [Gordonia sp. (in: high G+C Gram-positive bacteria)]
MSMSDEQVAKVLDTAVSLAEPVLDILSEADPFGLKAKTFVPRQRWQILPSSASAAATQALNVADFPGTKGWHDLDMNARADWWVTRLGAINAFGVAFPSMFGAWTKKLPLSTYLGAANQALVILAVAREYRVTERSDQIEMLGSVLFGRTVDGDLVDHAPAEPVDTKHRSAPAAIAGALWDLGKLLYQLQKSLDARPQAPRPLSMITWIPLVGGPASYIGERIALCRAVGAAQEWIVAHPDSVRARDYA